MVRGVQPSIGISSRGARGGSIERGRGRGRGSYHSTLGYQRSNSMYDEDGRGGGRVSMFLIKLFSGCKFRPKMYFYYKVTTMIRLCVCPQGPWLDRNGADASEWNGGSSTSPRKEYITRNSSVESWRRSRDDDSTSTTSTPTTTTASDTWRGIGPTTGYKWGLYSISMHYHCCV